MQQFPHNFIHTMPVHVTATAFFAPQIAAGEANHVTFQHELTDTGPLAKQLLRPSRHTHRLTGPQNPHAQKEININLIKFIFG